MTARRTWSGAREIRAVWRESHTPDWIPFGYAVLACGCLVDTFYGDEMREPCMAHEGEGHVSALSEGEDGMHVARCLVLACPWGESHVWESDAISAAQAHWRKTRTPGP